MRSVEGSSKGRRWFLQAAAVGSAYASAHALVPTLARSQTASGAHADGVLMQLSQLPPNYESVRSTFTTRITATERFYIRNHFAPPTIDPRQYRLTIAGLVRKPLALSLEELSRMRQVEMEAVLQCAGNGRALFRPRVPGVQWSRGAVGNATWRGVRLAELLHRAGADPKATMLQLTGADMPILPTTPRFVRGLPTAKALHEDTIVALAMNDAPLAPLHGAPVRLVVPGWVADGWTKWLTEVTVQNTEPTGFYYQTAYRYPIAPVEPGAAVPPEKTRPMEQLNVKSIVGSHEDGDIVEPGEQAIVGVAFAGEAGIRKVDVTVDGGRTWAPAKLDASASRYGFTRFTYRWQATPGATRIASRAEDRNGRVQPETPAWNPSGYLYNAIDPVAVEVRS